ncbi:mucin-associated surface protein [Arthrobacter sp. CDRTa11]|uniref:mucin-associated surface protein n=1 Tax=Arthrobacter sp. CDRTa11 TaxID=2651199 RepID=UPI002265CD74|nr:mucin-associated surface protein [Arthrobacter sp. CDRTa11]UZX02293.1 mucin-associated surface protein [Arthrobacter sp. CDRTa11]
MIFSENGHWRRGHRLAAPVAAALLLTAALAGCGPADPGIELEAARTLQEKVLGVTQAAAASDHAAALKTLDTLESDLAAAVTGGQVSEERRRTIMTALSAVRADLASAAAEAEAAAQAAAAKAAEEAAAAERAKAEADAAAKAAQEAASPPPAPADNAKGNEDKGEEKGKGKDD